MSKIKDLASMLEQSLKNLHVSKISFGNIHALAEAEKATSQQLQNIKSNIDNAKNRPDVIILIKKFLSDEYSSLTTREYNKLAPYINYEISHKKCIAYDKFKLTYLLNIYQQQIDDESLSSLVWNKIFVSYFAFNIQENNQQHQENLEIIRLFLANSFEIYTKTSRLLPWIVTLKENLNLLDENPCNIYAQDILNGNDTQIKEITKNISLSPASWFWSKLVTAVANTACKLNDDEFKNKLNTIIEMLKINPIFKNEVIIILLKRYYQCKSHAVHEEFKDYLIDKEIWGNPKLKMLKSASNSSNWNRVDENIWKMVLKWVTASNLKDFFELIASKYEADKTRMEFWQQYIEQIEWSKLIFGKNTLASINEDIKKLIASEEGVSAILQGAANADAFILQIGEYYIVEFSITSNAAYVYKQEQIYFNLYAKELSDGTGKKELKSGYRDYPCELKIQHRENWQDGVAQKLANLGIYTDNHNIIATKKLDKLDEIIEWAKYNEIECHDNRNSTGKIWIYHKYRIDKFAMHLKNNGFSYAEHMQAWYWEKK